MSMDKKPHGKGHEKGEKMDKKKPPAKGGKGKGNKKP
jgi:hypothetical protein